MLAVGREGAAQEQGERRVDPAKQGNIVIIQRQRGADAAPELRLPVRDGRLVLPESCPQGEEVANVQETEGDTRTRVLLCDGNGARTPAQMITTLERIRNSMAANTAISPEVRQRVERSLEQELQRLRSR